MIGVIEIIFMLISICKIRVSYTGEPNVHALCHCLDCRKISGSTYSNNLVVPENNFKLESGMSLLLFTSIYRLSPSSLRVSNDLMIPGTPKTISKKADSGKEITSHFCPNCGTTVFRTGESFPQAVIIKAGVLDSKEWASENVPQAELFCGTRVKWTPALESAGQLPGMPS